nr:hypothetical protein [Tanacetum cinerariifolium]
MVAILEKGEYNIDFHPMVDFIAASPLRYALRVKPTIFVSHIRQFWSTTRIKTTKEGTHILATVDGIQRTVSESSLRRNLKLQDKDGIVSLPDTELFENLTLIGPSFSRRIVPLFDTMLVHQGEGSGTPTEPHHTPSPEADPSYHTTSSMPLPSIPTAPILPVTQTETTLFGNTLEEQGLLSPLTGQPLLSPPLYPMIQHQGLLPLLLLRAAQEVEIRKLKDRVKVLEDREGVAATQSGDDAPIKGMSIDEGEATTERISDDSEELARVLTSMDAATILAGGIDVPTGSGFPLLVPLLVTFPLADKEVMVESDTPKKQRFQEQIDAQVARELEEQQERENKRMTEQIASNTEVARIHVEEELQGMIDSLDRTNETIAKWKLYDLCGVHQVTAKDKDIFMLVEKDYPLRKGLAIVMISYKLQVETYSRMANELVLKIYKIASTLRQWGD